MITPLQKKGAHFGFVLCHYDYNNDQSNIKRCTKNTFSIITLINTRFWLGLTHWKAVRWLFKPNYEWGFSRHAALFWIIKLIISLLIRHNILLIPPRPVSLNNVLSVHTYRQTKLHVVFTNHKATETKYCAETWGQILYKVNIEPLKS